MKTARRYEAGFSIPLLLPILVILGIIGFTGWYVWNAQKSSDRDLKPVDSVAVSPEPKQQDQTDKPDEYKIPDGYRQYHDNDLGFSFAYPEVFGELKLRSYGDYSTLLATERLSQQEPYKQHIYDDFSIQLYGADESVVSRKYGPEVAIKDDKVIVTNTNPADTIDNKVGEEYRNFYGEAADSQVNKGLRVFTLKGGDEGSIGTVLLFQKNGKLVVLSLASFDSGTYGPDAGGPFDQAEYNAMVKNVTDSVRPV